jgi:ATP-dependent protease ClpP protease subunit
MTETPHKDALRAKLTMLRNTAHSVELRGPVDATSERMIRVECQRAKGNPVRLFIDSLGGCGDTARRIVDALAAYPGAVTAFVRAGATAQSAGALVWAGAPERQLDQGGTVLFHRCGLDHAGRFTAFDFQMQADYLRGFDEWQIGLVCRITGRTRAEVETIFDSGDAGELLDATSAKSFGLLKVPERVVVHDRQFSAADIARGNQGGPFGALVLAAVRRGFVPSRWPLVGPK